MNMIEPRLDLYFLEDDAEHGKEQSIGKAGIVRNSISISYQLLNGLKPSSNRAFLTVLADSTAVEDMIRAEGNIGAVLSDGNDIWFTGYLSTDWNWTVTDRGVSALSITIEDVGTRLLKKSSWRRRNRLRCRFLRMQEIPEVYQAQHGCRPR